ncbi:hypothetical protein TRIUR3_29919 [Triticum urartu]|uniref:Uncharacterized protein n=1 Tax=Triticum urartu TaxID=4572 RepID=M8AIY4_TRIUA|nr:hypothetical protein TRIUR3_29919 [Triticum urartu]
MASYEQCMKSYEQEKHVKKQSEVQSGGTRLVVGRAMQCSAIHPSAMQFTGRCVDPSKINCTPVPRWYHAVHNKEKSGFISLVSRYLM